MLLPWKKSQTLTAYALIDDRPQPRLNRHSSNDNQLPSHQSSSTDELFFSESYPPTARAVHLPFFDLKLDSPLGMGRGQPILPQRTPSPVYGSVDRIWKRITDILLEKPYQLGELVDTLSYPAQQSSLNSLHRSLSNYHLQLPSVVRDHFLTHDGQDVFTSHSSQSSTAGSSLGIVWGLWLMSCEEVEAEYGFWRRFDGGLIPTDAFTATNFSSSYSQQPHLKQQDHASSSSSINSLSSSSSLNQARFNQSMSSCPAGWVHEFYSHPGWLPLLSDRVGNYIGVDLSPPLLQPSSSLPSPSPCSHSPHHRQVNQTSSSSSSSSSSSKVDPYLQHLGGGQGNARPEPGQVIAFGREIDQKVVLWRGEGSQGWANWLASFADDLEDGKFARLIGRKVKKSPNIKSSSKSRRNSDGERGRWSNSDDDSDDTEDGLGDLGYFNQDTAFAGQDDDGEFHGWKLAPEYRGMSVIEALCARSQKRWAEVGSYSSRHAHSQYEENKSNGPPGGARQSPELASVAQAGGASHPPSNHCSPLANESFASEKKNTNPATPIAFVTPPSPRPSEPNMEYSITPSSKPCAVASPTQAGGGGSPMGLQPIPPHRSQKQPQTKIDPKPRRPRVPPPVPMSLDLPTMDSLMLEAAAHPSPTKIHHSQPRTSTNLSSTTTSITPSSSTNNRAETRFHAPQIAGRFSMAGPRMTEEMGRRASSSSSTSGPGSPHRRSSLSPSRKTKSSSRTDANQKDMIGMVMIINEDKNSLNHSNENLNSLSTSHNPPLSNTTSTTTNTSVDNQFHQNRNPLAIKLDSSRSSDSEDVRKLPDGLGIMKTIA